MNITRKLMTREGFVALVMGGVGGIVTIAFGVPIVGFLLSPLIKGQPEVWRDVGARDSFKEGSTVQVAFLYPDQVPWSGPTAYTAAWLRRTGPDNFVAFAKYCTHLGCPVQWLATPEIFLCPCHGSVFNADGTVADGPAPRPLFVYQTKVVNGRVLIKTEPQPTVGFTTA